MDFSLKTIGHKLSENTENQANFKNYMLVTGKTHF